MGSFPEGGVGNSFEFLADYGAVVADDLNCVGVRVEDAHPHRRGGEQEPEDTVPQVLGVRRLDPSDLGVGQVRVGGDEPLQEEAQRDAQGESQDDAAEDKEVQRPAQVQPADSERRQEEDRGEQIGSHDGRAAVAVDGESPLPVLQPAYGLSRGALDLGHGAHALHEEPVVGREPVQLSARLPLHHHHDGRVLQGVVAAQDLVPEDGPQLPRVDKQAPHSLQREQYRQQEEEYDHEERYEHYQQQGHGLTFVRVYTQ